MVELLKIEWSFNKKFLSIDLDYNKFLLWEKQGFEMIMYNDYYFLSTRIDKYFCWQDLSIQEYINICFFIWWSRTTEIQKNINNKFFLTIQYDNWLEEVPIGFHIKLFTNEWYNQYFWKNWINDIDIPYICVEI